MNKENMMKAIEICMIHRGTVEFKPVVNGFVKDEYLGLIYSCPALINELVKNNFSLSLQEGHIIIDKIN